MGKDNHIYGSPWGEDIDQVMATLKLRRMRIPVAGLIDAIAKLAQIEAQKDQESEDQLDSPDIWDRLEAKGFKFGDPKDDKPWDRNGI